ncbi:hypothetical protein P7H16_01055 [Paenibacillus larvae]|nr:hypothetical protein [Paenibacillus larvae]MDT2245876.1 hypothetical protein [Paenibacillus larvae]
MRGDNCWIIWNGFKFHTGSQLPEETRTNLKIVDRKTEVTTEINEKGTEVSAETIRHFRREFTGLLDEASLLVIGGSLPPGISPQFYAEIIREAEKKVYRLYWMLTERPSERVWKPLLLS